MFAAVRDAYLRHRALRGLMAPPGDADQWRGRIPLFGVCYTFEVVVFEGGARPTLVTKVDPECGHLLPDWSSATTSDPTAFVEALRDAVAAMQRKMRNGTAGIVHKPSAVSWSFMEARSALSGCLREEQQVNEDGSVTVLWTDLRRLDRVDQGPPGCVAKGVNGGSARSVTVYFPWRRRGVTFTGNAAWKLWRLGQPHPVE